MKKQTPEELERGYEKPDPWGYQSSPADIERKARIVGACSALARTGTFGSALDIACGEGWITADLPARELNGYEASRLARSRIPKNIWAFGPETRPPYKLKCDLVVCTGALYEHYDWELFVKLIERHSTDVIVTCSIADWEFRRAIDLIRTFASLRTVECFPYNRPEAKYTQCLRVFKRYPASHYEAILL